MVVVSIPQPQGHGTDTGTIVLRYCYLMVNCIKTMFCRSVSNILCHHRYERITAEFKKRYNGVSPAFFARAPGRVNLIGEKICVSVVLSLEYTKIFLLILV